jgi:uncharacterized membrane protein YqjE
MTAAHEEVGMSQIVNRRDRVTGNRDPMLGRTDSTGHEGLARPVDRQSTGELVQHASEQIARLVREELALARIELSEKGRHAGKGAGLLGGGGLLALYGIGLLLIVAVLALAEAMPGWLAALIVTVVVFLVAGGMALWGRKQVRQAVPAMPEETAQSVRADVDRVTAAVRDRSVPGRGSTAAEPAGAGPIGAGTRIDGSRSGGVWSDGLRGDGGATRSDQPRIGGRS